MKKCFVLLSALATMGFLSRSYGGFVSSNGMSTLSGLICHEPPSGAQRIEWQIKYLPARGGYVARKVIYSSNGQISVFPISTAMDCDVTRYANEPAIENRCYGRQNAQMRVSSSVFQSLPFRDQLHFVLQSPLVEGGSLWKSFPSSNCRVIPNDNIIP